MSNLDKAVEDIVWLSNRLSGIIGLREEITTLADMKRKVSSLETAEVSLKQEITDLEKAKKDLDADIKKKINALGTKTKDAEAKAELILEAANANGKALVEQANKDAEAVLAAANTTKAILEQEINKLKETVDAVKNQVFAEENKLRKIKDEMARLKDSI